MRSAHQNKNREIYSEAELMGEVLNAKTKQNKTVDRVSV